MPELPKLVLRRALLSFPVRPAPIVSVVLGAPPVLQRPQVLLQRPLLLPELTVLGTELLRPPGVPAGGGGGRAAVRMLLCWDPALPRQPLPGLGLP